MSTTIAQQETLLTSEAKAIQRNDLPRTVQLGDLTLRVPLAIGCLQWGTTVVDDVLINRTGVLSEATCARIVDTVVRKAGVALFDTAEGYGGGTSEKRLGRLLGKYRHDICEDDDGDDGDEKKRNSNSTSSINNTSSPSSSFICMTKFLPAPWRAFRGDLERAARASARRLAVDCIDVYLLHSPVHWRPVEFWIEAAARCKRDHGWIRHMGLSNANADQVRRAVRAGARHGIRIVCNQVHFSLLAYNSVSLQEMKRTCDELGVIVIGFSPIGQGLLTDQLTDEKWAANKPAKMLRLQRHDLDGLRTVLHRMAVKYQRSMAQVAINWCIQHGVVPLVGCRSVEQATDTVGSLGWCLAPEDVQALNAVALDKSTLESPPWRRALFVALFGVVHVVCRLLDTLGWGRLDLQKGESMKIDGIEMD